jgi:hypothetical protein
MAIDAGKINEPVGVEETPHDRGDSVQAIHINEKLVNEESYGLGAGIGALLRDPRNVRTFRRGRSCFDQRRPNRRRWPTEVRTPAAVAHQRCERQRTKNLDTKVDVAERTAFRVSEHPAVPPRRCEPCRRRCGCRVCACKERPWCDGVQWGFV